MFNSLNHQNAESDAGAFANQNPVKKIELRDEMDLLRENKMVPSEPEVFQYL